MGGIVNIGSRTGSAKFTIGGSVNAALLNFTEAMAGTGIPQGVRVNAINPGLIATDRFERNVERVMREGVSAATRRSHCCCRRTIPPCRIAGGNWRSGRLHRIRQGGFHSKAIIDVAGGATRSL
jgi:NAD(P)-dependent dehydrogenase (short-subunit alcohol dehydrogenase family)